MPNKQRGNTYKVFPFRHFEERFHWLGVAALILLIPMVRCALLTISGVSLVALFFSISAIIGFIIWRRMHRHFGAVMSQIVQGHKRIVILSLSVSLSIATLLSGLVLFTNYYIPTDSVRYVDAQASIISHGSSGRRSFGSITKFSFEGSSYYQLTSRHDDRFLESSNHLQLELRKGLLGYEYISSIKKTR